MPQCVSIITAKAKIRSRKWDIFFRKTRTFFVNINLTVFKVNKITDLAVNLWPRSHKKSWLLVWWKLCFFHFRLTTRYFLVNPGIPQTFFCVQFSLLQDTDWIFPGPCIQVGQISSMHNPLKNALERVISSKLSGKTTS